jgi:hypothetical protein
MNMCMKRFYYSILFSGYRRYRLFCASIWRVFEICVRLLPLPQHQLRAHGRTNKSKRPESHPTTECARACVLCLKTEPTYYYCPITLVMT